ncbi:hypothetical protein H0H92_008227 [Tricholoma furcatifolium]|nr:hypothetical protein H0H92_008227 [Tricholoma furcatifolium]
MTDQADIPMDVDTPDSSPFTSTKAVPPLFNFPQDAQRTFTAKDIISILRYCKTKFLPGKPKPSTKKRPYIAEAFQRLTGQVKTGHDRQIFRTWPRKPDGEYITPDNSALGKSTPNGIQFWGATLFDFYRVQRMPGLFSLQTISTGSKLMKWMKAHGESDYAKDEIEWAEMEEDPRVILPWSPRAKIEEVENYVREGKIGNLLKNAGLEGKDEMASTESPFKHTTYYSSSWPLTPFEYEIPRLTETIDFDRLPKTLMVHDPWNILAVKSENDFGPAEPFEKGDKWGSKEDRVHIYKLKLTLAGIERAERDAEKRAKSKEAEAKLNAELDAHVDPAGATPLDGHLIRPPAIPGPVVPPVFVVHPPRPEPRTPSPTFEPIDEAHLYLSPSHPIGSGNHSEVYSAEWEVPRAAIIPPPSPDYILCDTCVAEDIARIIREEDGDDGENMDPQWKTESGEVKVVPLGRPSVVFHCVGPDLAEEEGTAETEDTTYFAEYCGPVRPIRTTVEWQDPMHPTCTHIQPPPKVPPTTKMRVVAKLSHRADRHLANEAKNYEVFERHMCENWTGFNVLPPMHDPVPVGALVPQYYGYYVAEQDLFRSEWRWVNEVRFGSPGRRNEPVRRPVRLHLDEEIEAIPLSEEDPKYVGYLSPLLLMEDCGTAIQPSKLTHDQK